MMLCETGNVKDIEKYHLKRVGERKIDGCRCFAICDVEVALVGRSGTSYTKKFPEIVNALKGFYGILDCEIFCGDFDKTSARVHTENPFKAKILMNKNPAVLYVFDVLQVGHIDLTKETYIERMKNLNSLPIWNTFIQKVDKSLDLVNMWSKVLQNAWEGLILKDVNSKYENKRSFSWLKVKNIKSKDLVAVKYDINPAGIRVETKEGIALQVAGLQSEAVKRRIDETGSCKIEVNYLEETSSGMLRMPTFKVMK